MEFAAEYREVGVVVLSRDGHELGYSCLDGSGLVRELPGGTNVGRFDDDGAFYRLTGANYWEPCGTIDDATVSGIGDRVEIVHNAWAPAELGRAELIPLGAIVSILG